MWLASFFLLGLSLVYLPAEMQLTVDQENFGADELNYTSLSRLAKNISHSRGPVVQNREGEHHYRRSFVRKVLLEVNSQALKKWIDIFKYDINLKQDSLEELEFLVHQFDTAVDFMKSGGIEMMLPVTQHDDPKIVSAAFSVLAAAMQGNPDVQHHAEKHDFIRFILRALHKTSDKIIPSVLSALSSFLRNMPDHQLEFCDERGVSLLAKLLTNPLEPEKTKLKIITLLGDLSAEIFEASEDNQKRKKILQRVFEDKILDAGICKEIPIFLQFKDYLTHEKTLYTMNEMQHMCVDEFGKQHVIDSVNELSYLYDPYASPSFSSIDQELKVSVFSIIKSLLDKIYNSHLSNRTEL